MFGNSCVLMQFFHNRQLECIELKFIKTCAGVCHHPLLAFMFEINNRTELIRRGVIVVLKRILVVGVCLYERIDVTVAFGVEGLLFLLVPQHGRS